MSVDRRQPPQVPNVVHQICWETTDLGELNVPCWCSVASWRRFASKYGWRYRLWKEKEVESLFHPSAWRWLTSHKLHHMRAIVASYQLLYQHGGLVADSSLIWLGALLAGGRTHLPTNQLLAAIARHSLVVLPPDQAMPSVPMQIAAEASIMAAAPGHSALHQVLHHVRDMASGRNSTEWRDVATHISTATLRQHSGVQSLPSAKQWVFYNVTEHASGAAQAAPFRTVTRTASQQNRMLSPMSAVQMSHLAWVQPPRWWRSSNEAARAFALPRSPPIPTGTGQCLLESRVVRPPGGTPVLQSVWRVFHPPGNSAPIVHSRITWNTDVNYTMQWPGKAEHLKKLSKKGVEGRKEAEALSRPKLFPQPNQTKATAPRDKGSSRAPSGAQRPRPPGSFGAGQPRTAGRGTGHGTPQPTTRNAAADAAAAIARVNTAEAEFRAAQAAMDAIG